MTAVREAMLADAEALVGGTSGGASGGESGGGGVDGLMLENFGDAPFHPGPVPGHVLTHMAALAAELRRRFDLPLGINVLRNDACGALAVAHAVGAEFIRVNVLRGARVTDQGVIEGKAHELLRLRRNLGAEHIRILADVAVKHSAPLGSTPIEQEAADAAQRGGADALLVSGTATGRAVDLATLRRVRAVAGGRPILLGSGVTPETVEPYLPEADGLIAGTALKEGGAVEAPVDPHRVEALMARVR
jgi:membrane complex biogenesis BtpA family protein